MSLVMEAGGGCITDPETEENEEDYWRERTRTVNYNVHRGDVNA